MPCERVRSKIVAWPIEVLQGDARSWERRQVEGLGGGRESWGRSERKVSRGEEVGTRDAQGQVSHVRVPFERVRSKIVAWPIEVLQGDAKSWERTQVEDRRERGERLNQSVNRA